MEGYVGRPPGMGRREGNFGGGAGWYGAAATPQVRISNGIECGLGKRDVLFIKCSAQVVIE
jgi:hypothetical protein